MQRQRAQRHNDIKVDKKFLLNPGDLDCMKMRADMSEVCDIAFVAYETLYNLTTHPLSVSTLAWGSSLDVSTVRLHYGKRVELKQSHTIGFFERGLCF